jgi:hypothetical protein
MKYGNKRPIRYESELAMEFGRLTAEDRRLEGFEVLPQDRPEKATLQIDRQSHSFIVRYLLTPTKGDVFGSEVDEEPYLLFVVPHLTDALLEVCRERRASIIDLNGRCYLRCPDLLVQLSPLPGRRFRFELEPRNIYVGKSVRIVRAILSDPDRSWRQAELVEKSGATSGLVSRIVTYLVRQGLLEKTGSRNYHLTSVSALLDSWAKADDFQRRVNTVAFTALENDTVALARRLRNALTHDGPHFAFTQWIAAWLRHPYTEPPVVSLYVPHLPSADLLDHLGLRRVHEGGRVWFHLPNDEGVFRETRIVEDLPLVSDAQIYLDLLHTGLRGPEQAKALREWSGFCQP